jgi:O-antigen/teichoic acid export membrane protein
LIRPGAWLSLGGMAGLLIAGVDRAVVARAGSLEAVTVFALSGAAFLLAEAMLTSAVDAARPALGQALGAGRRQEAARIYLRLVNAAAVAGPLAALGIFAANRAFVTAWAGEQSYGGWTLDLWFGLALVVNLWSLPHRALLSADLRVREATLWRLGEGALNLALSVGLALRFGIAGVAAGTTLAGVSTSFWALPRLASHSADIPVRRILGPLFRGLALWAVLAPLAWLAREAADTRGFLAAALAAMAVSAAGGALWWRVGLTDESRRFWLVLARERRAAWPAAV